MNRAICYSREELNEYIKEVIKEQGEDYRNIGKVLKVTAAAISNCLNGMNKSTDLMLSIVIYLGYEIKIEEECFVIGEAGSGYELAYNDGVAETLEYVYELVKKNEKDIIDILNIVGGSTWHASEK